MNSPAHSKEFASGRRPHSSDPAPNHPIQTDTPAHRSGGSLPKAPRLRREIGSWMRIAGFDDDPVANPHSDRSRDEVRRRVADTLQPGLRLDTDRLKPRV